MGIIVGQGTTTILEPLDFAKVSEICFGSVQSQTFGPSFFAFFLTISFYRFLSQRETNILEDPTTNTVTTGEISRGMY
jgi:hypothetical protein